MLSEADGHEERAQLWSQVPADMAQRLAGVAARPAKKKMLALDNGPKEKKAKKAPRDKKAEPGAHDAEAAEDVD